MMVADSVQWKGSLMAWLDLNLAAGLGGSILVNFLL